MAGPPMINLGEPTVKRYVRTGPERMVPEKSAYPLDRVQEWSWEYWFNYFYRELPYPTDRKKFFLAISPTEGVYRMDADVPLAEKTTLLREMMNLGFQAYPVDARVSAAEMFATLNQKHDLQKLGVKVIFRGDGRPPARIKENLGTKPQTQVPELSAARGFNNTWHPWNDAVLAHNVYFRKGNADNCLFTAISVTPEFFVATKFPLLNDLKATMPWAVGKVLVETAPHVASAGLSQVALQRQRFLAGDKKETRTLLCSKTNIYAVKVKKGWNTAEYQLKSGAGTFPERAYDNIRWIDHFAVLRVIRIHFSDDPNAGHLVIVENLEWLQPDPILEKYLGAPGLQELRSFLAKMRNGGALTGGTGGMVYTPEATIVPPFEIKRVLQFTWA